jgi:hypothetical protein
MEFGCGLRNAAMTDLDRLERLETHITKTMAGFLTGLRLSSKTTTGTDPMTTPPQVAEVLNRMRAHKVNHGKNTSPALIAFANEIESALSANAEPVAWHDDVQTVVEFMFREIGRPEHAYLLTDAVVKAVRRLERNLADFPAPPAAVPVESLGREAEPDNRAEWSLHDRVEFALRDAGFDYDEAFEIASLSAGAEPVAPWPDFAGATIRSGDRIAHPDGAAGTVVYVPGFDGPHDSWRVVYDGSAELSRLCLQIGDKGMASVIRRSAHPPPIPDAQEGRRQ